MAVIVSDPIKQSWLFFAAAGNIPRSRTRRTLLFKYRAYGAGLHPRHALYVILKH